MKFAITAAVLAAMTLLGWKKPRTVLADTEWAAVRAAMVSRQIEARGVKDRLVLDALRRVPRHLFVPTRVEAESYEDRALPIGHGQTISQPYIVAAMTELASLKGGEKVLEIGTGSGYQAAVLAEIAGSVYSIEIVPELAQEARTRLKRLGYDRVKVRTGDGWAGWPEEAPFDAIIVTAAPETVPPPLVEQLKTGGRLVIPVGPREDQKLQRLVKTATGLKKESVFPVRFVPFLRAGETPEAE
jgi:protein-L-isoaspartate(D-aspartate) O-methyltransferase